MRALTLIFCQPRGRELFGSFDVTESLMNKLDGASVGAVPQAPVVNEVVQAVTYDTSATLEPAAEAVEKVAESVTLPAVELPSIAMPSIDGLDLPLPVIGGIAVAALIAVVVGSSGGNKSSPPASSGSSSASSESSSAPSESSPASSESSSTLSESSSASADDVSIPYDAAAMLAYEEAGKPGDFESFKKKYRADTVKMVKSKQQTRIKA